MKFGTLPTGGPEPHACGAAGSDLASILRSLSRLAGAERFPCDVLDVRGEIANDALRIDKTWLLGAGCAKSNELHGGSSWASRGHPAGRGLEVRRGSIGLSLRPSSQEGSEAAEREPTAAQIGRRAALRAKSAGDGSHHLWRTCDCARRRKRLASPHCACNSPSGRRLILRRGARTYKCRHPGRAPPCTPTP